MSSFKNKKVKGWYASDTIHRIVANMSHESKNRILDAYDIAGKQFSTVMQRGQPYIDSREARSEQNYLMGYVHFHAPEIASRVSKLPESIVRLIGKILISGEHETVYWPNPSFLIATEGIEAFEDVPVKNYHIVETNTLWIFENMPQLKGSPNGEYGMLLIPSADKSSMALVALTFKQDGNLPIMTIELLHPFKVGEPAKELRTMAGTEFIRIPIVQKETCQYSAHEKQKAYKQRRQLRNASVITLRRIEREKNDSSNLSDREYSCQWIRRGHWRKLHQPKEDGTEVVRVSPAICGPDDKPLKQPTQRIFEVRR